MPILMPSLKCGRAEQGRGVRIGCLTAVMLAVAPLCAAANDGARNPTMAIEETGPQSVAERSTLRVTVSAVGRGSVAASSLTLNLGLKSGALGAGGSASSNRKVIASTLVLDAAANDVAPSARGNQIHLERAALARPADHIDADTVFVFQVTSASELAKAAVRACALQGPSSGAPQLLEISASLTWRLKVGTFVFDWRNYDRVAPDATVIDNPAFYADTQTIETSVTLPVAVLCEAGSNTTIASLDTSTSTTSVQTTQVSLTSELEPICTGGVLRDVAGGGIACLCPETTVQVATGVDSFACRRTVRGRQ